MSRTIRGAWFFFVALILSTPLNADAAPSRSAEAFLAGMPVLLEVRYCECAAADTNRASSELLPGFFQSSNLLKVGAARDDEGFVSSDGFALGYGIKEIDGGPSRFLLTYSAEYTTDTESNSGYGEVLVDEGRWVYLFGASHTTGAEPEHTGVAIRITNREP